jgi:hypothetical protein
LRPLLVGESNPYRNDDYYALYPDPENSAGGRLCFKIMELSTKDYIRSFDRQNLCAGKWSLPAARATADRIKLARHNGSSVDATVVLFGSKVCSAFGLDFKPFSWRQPLAGSGFPVVILPHPSGLNRIWNEPGAIERARGTLHSAGLLDLPCRWCEGRGADCRCPIDGEGGLMSTDTTTQRPARCSNCGLLVRDADCPECGPW